MFEAELIEVIEVGNTLGEGVIWNQRDQSVWWTDIESSQLFRYHLANAKLTQWQTPERLCSFGFVKDSEALIAAFESGFALYAPETGKVEWLGRVDRQGRFWAGSMVESNATEQASLYSLSGDGSSAIHESKIEISNGLSWSPNSATMYFADSPKRKIFNYSFDSETGTPSAPTLFAETPEDIYPDGSTVDTKGYLWNAQWGGNRVVRYAEDGAIDLVLDVPVKQPSCVAFGGPDLETLFVTSAKQGMTDKELAEDPLAGHLLIYQTSVQGLPECEYQPDAKIAARIN